MANKTASKIVEDLYWEGYHFGLDYTEGDKPNEKIISTALLSLCDLIIEGMEKDSEGIIAFLDKEGKRYYQQKDLVKGACNQVLSSCKESVRKMLGVER